jgi:hypothetical protein
MSRPKIPLHSATIAWPIVGFLLPTSRYCLPTSFHSNRILYNYYLHLINNVLSFFVMSGGRSFYAFPLPCPEQYVRRVPSPSSSFHSPLSSLSTPLRHTPPTRPLPSTTFKKQGGGSTRLRLTAHPTRMRVLNARVRRVKDPSSHPMRRVFCVPCALDRECEVLLAPALSGSEAKDLSSHPTRMRHPFRRSMIVPRNVPTATAQPKCRRADISPCTRFSQPFATPCHRHARASCFSPACPPQHGEGWVTSSPLTIHCPLFGTTCDTR